MIIRYHQGASKILVWDLSRGNIIRDSWVFDGGRLRMRGELNEFLSVASIPEAQSKSRRLGEMSQKC